LPSARERWTGIFSLLENYYESFYSSTLIFYPDLCLANSFLPVPIIAATFVCIYLAKYPS
jgi:hypothetical protein